MTLMQGVDADLAMHAVDKGFHIGCAASPLVASHPLTPRSEAGSHQTTPMITGRTLTFPTWPYCLSSAMCTCLPSCGWFAHTFLMSLSSHFHLNSLERHSQYGASQPSRSTLPPAATTTSALQCPPLFQKVLFRSTRHARRRRKKCLLPPRQPLLPTTSSVRQLRRAT